MHSRSLATTDYIYVYLNTHDTHSTETIFQPEEVARKLLEEFKPCLNAFLLDSLLSLSSIPLPLPFAPSMQMLRPGFKLSLSEMFPYGTHP